VVRVTALRQVETRRAAKARALERATATNAKAVISRAAKATAEAKVPLLAPRGVMSEGKGAKT